MQMSVLEMEGDDPLSINARDDEGAEALARSCSPARCRRGRRVLLRSGGGARVVVDATVGELLISM